jgi:hypothetical protein
VSTSLERFLKILLKKGDDDKDEEEPMDTGNKDQLPTSNYTPPLPPLPQNTGVRPRVDSTPSVSSDYGSKLPRAYFNIRADKLNSMPVRTSKGCAGKARESVSSFQTNDDIYLATAKLQT